jgi:hypothetical protein
MTFKKVILPGHSIFFKKMKSPEKSKPPMVESQAPLEKEPTRFAINKTRRKHSDLLSLFLLPVRISDERSTTRIEQKAPQTFGLTMREETLNGRSLP